MELDQLLNLTSVVAGKLLPILGAAVLVFLIIFLRKLIALLISANEAMGSLNSTLESANKQIDALDKPLQTLNELSETVDNVHEASKSVLRSVLSALLENVQALIQAVTNRNAQEEIEKETMVRGDEHEPRE